MERYIAKINNKVLTHPDEKVQRRIKTTYLAIGGSVLAVGIAGFLASFITFIVLFMDAKTDESMTAWVLAVIFMIVFIAGSVVTRIGDKLLTEGYNETVERKKKVKE